jgi:hypothetical protein
MKSFLLIAAIALAGISVAPMERAEAYSSNVGADPKNDDPGFGRTGYGDLETKVFVKSATSGKSGEVSARHVLAYSSEADGYTLTRQITRTLPGLRQLACVAMDAVTTGDTAYHRCITKGYVRVKYDGSVYNIGAGIPACVNESGVVTGCFAGAGEATLDTGILPLESKTDAGEYLKAIVNLQ